MKASLKELLKGIYFVRITLIFVISYIAISLIIIYFKQYALSPIFIFITSPFNPLENFSTVYSSFSEGYFLNVEFVMVEILIAELYSRFLLKKYKQFLSIDSAFCFAILASYATAVIYWGTIGMPSSGTSIIGFSIILFLAFNSISDVKSYSNKLYLREIKHVPIFYLCIASIIFSVPIGASYIIGNQSYIAHIIGALIFGAFMVTYYILKRRKIHRLS